MIQESSIVEGIVHMMAENDHNSYFQIVCFEVMALKLLFENTIQFTIKLSSDAILLKPHYKKKHTFWNYFVFNVCVVVFISISLRAPCLMNSTQRCVRIG